MHFVTTTAMIGMAMAASSAAFSLLPATECLSTKSAIEQVDIDELMQLARTKVCDKGCSLMWSDFKSTLRDNYAIPIMTAEADKMGLSDLTPHFISLMDAAYDMADQKCGGSELDHQDFCQISEQAAKDLAECTRDNMWTLAISKAGDFLPILLANPCKKMNDYLRDPQLIEQTIPANLEHYASQCGK